MAASSKAPEIFVIPDNDSSSWRMRDASYRMLYHRYGPPEDSDMDGGGAHKRKKMPVSSHFDADTCLARIRRDKAGVVRSAFDAAATAVLEAVEKTLDHHEKKIQMKRRLSLDASELQHDLPPFLAKYSSLQDMRTTTMERAHNNKEYAKKRGFKTESTLSKVDGDTKPIAKDKGEPPATNKGEGGASKKEDGPKFTRNTPASSAAALDSRSTNSRAILCTAANVYFEVQTPPLGGAEIDVTDVPQNPAKKKSEGDNNDALADSPSKPHATSTVNMGNVVVEAQALGQRAVAVASNAVRRAKQRYQFRKDNIRFGQPRKPYFQFKNPFALTKGVDSSDGDDEDISGILEETVVPYNPNEDSVTEVWSDVCLPRLLSILRTGAGHAILHDVGWRTRHGRIADMFRVLASDHDNYGTHLVITTEPDVALFAQEFQYVNQHVTLLNTVNSDSLRALTYGGNAQNRRKLRPYFPKATGLPASPFHILITSYSVFLEDYLHFCQMPWEVVLVDDGASWMGAAQSDPNSPIGTLWQTAMFSTKDQQIGLAGTGFKKWNFSAGKIPTSAQKEAWIGLTARNRILTSSVLKVQQRTSVDIVPVTGLLSFALPHFADVVREEWDRSRIHADQASMEHFRTLLTRSTVVHHATSDCQDMRVLAMDALTGQLPPSDRSHEPEVPEVIPDEAFVNDGKVAFSRRSSLTWLGPSSRSWLRYELAVANFQPILDAMSRSSTYGHNCEEIITASSTTSSGAAGQVTGTLAYRLAVRCGRHFGSEQGLRQHLSAMHAPAGTWLCRTCGADCVTSQARTHHERTCGQPSVGAATKDANPSAGQGSGSRQSYGPVGVVGKKKGQRAATATPGAAAARDKDPDGSFRVPGFRGVWVNPQGKHFVKVKGERLTSEGSSDTKFFDSIEEAAKGHDNAVKANGEDPKAELNYQADGTRIVYEDVTTSTTTGLGGSANNVVPALSIINIKDLPATVRPLLRDPRQTSRTGGNSKRHVYAYRGVCRQARKGHDRWQSQISFMGVNHYLGTFDSEWDAAAIYAWAHLILYGEEATKKAQQEGEEAAAAYEKEKQDIAAGRIPEPQLKIEKKKQKPAKKEKKEDATTKKKSTEKATKTGDKTEEPKKKKRKKNTVTAGSGPVKVLKPSGRADKEAIAPILSKGASKVPILASRTQFQSKSDAELIQDASGRVTALRNAAYCIIDNSSPAPVDALLRPCLPVKIASTATLTGGAMLLGLSSLSFGWDVGVFVSLLKDFESRDQERQATSALSAEFGDEGTNESFRTLMQGPLCLIGNASLTMRKAHKTLGLGSIPIGSSVGEIDCHIGGIPQSCSETAASIRYAPTSASSFQFAAFQDDDIVTLNGKRITPGMGSFPLFNEDVCTVGARVFVFLLPMDK